MDLMGESPKRLVRLAIDGYLLALFICLNAPIVFSRTIYVKHDAAGANTGVSWPNAYRDLQSALGAAAAGDEIWVAKGTYKPTSGADRTKSFVLVGGVKHYGGFLGTETAPGQRNWATQVTTLSGDIGVAGVFSDNSYHVVTGSNQSTLDGFTVSGGNATTSYPNDSGGGMLNRAVSLSIANCNFIGNAAGFQGAGMFNEQTTATVTNCAFSNNTAINSGTGGGLSSTGGSSIVSHCTFSGNTAWLGGGIMSFGSPSVMHCVFNDNRTSSWGAGMHNAGGSPTVTNCVFIANTSEDGGGGGYSLRENCFDTLTSCTFSSNLGGGLYNRDGAPTLTDCLFTSNTAGLGGGVKNSGSSTLINCTFSGNESSSGGGGMFSFSGDFKATNCIFSSNTANSSGGGIIIQSGSPIITNCLFNGNTAIGWGGGLYHFNGSTSVINCTFTGNSVTDSDGTSYGGGIQLTFGAVTVVNCIVWQNSATHGPEIYKSINSAMSITNCNVGSSDWSGGGWNPSLGTNGGGNVSLDPKFVNATNPAGLDRQWRTADDGLMLRHDSPCINKGTSAGAPVTDIRGNSRTGLPDIGAYEPKGKAGAGAWWLCIE